MEGDENIVKKTLFLLTLTTCATFICLKHTFAQQFVEGQMPDTFLAGHTGDVNSVAFSPDGKTITSGSSDNTIRLWDVSTGTEIRTLQGHTDDVNSVAFSPDGKTIASGSSDGTVKLWDVATGTVKATLKGHWNLVRSVAFSPDGKTIASGSSGNTDIRLWDAATGTLKTTMEVFVDTVWSVVFSPDGKTIANSGSRNATLQFRDAATGSLKATLEGHMAGVQSVVFSPDGKTIASGSFDGTVKLWEVPRQRQPKGPKATLSDHGQSVASVAFSPDGTRLASGCDDNVVRLWNALPLGNDDGVVNIADLVEVAQNFGQVGENNADINGDGIVNVVDLILVAVALGEVPGAPAAHAHVLSMLTVEEVSQWLIEAKRLQTEDPIYLRGILMLEQLLTILNPKETVLLANYPNPFNPETWIPYQLAGAADVSLTLYDINGHAVRTLDLGYQHAGVYQSRSRAAYWDGKNELGESVASGLYFYTLTAGDFTATRKMLIRK